MPTMNYLKTLITGINANKGTQNCAHCALRFDKHIAEGKNLALGSVPVENANFFTHPLFKDGKITRSTSQDKRLLERCSSPPPDYRFVCSLTDEDNPEFIIDLTANPSPTEQVRLYPATEQDIANQLLSLARRKKDGTAYGFILLTHEKRVQSAHLINFYIDVKNQIYFIDAQRQKEEEQITTRLNMQGYRKEIFYIPSIPPEGLKLKGEKTNFVADKVKNDEKKARPKKRKTIAENESTKKSPHSDAERNRVLEAKKFAERNDSNAWVNFGNRNLNGVGGERNPAKAFNSFQKATQVDEKNAIAWHALACCYLKGEGTEHNPAEAFKCFQKTTQLDEKHADAWMFLAACYREGVGTDRNPAEAFNCFQKATQVDEKNATAWNNFGACYLRGDGTVRNPIEAYKCFQKATELNPKYAPSWINLGDCYRYGVGIEPNPIEAFKCYQKTTQLDEKNVKAWNNLGVCYQNGFGTASNPDEALKCYTKANLLNSSFIVPPLSQLKPPSPTPPVVAAPVVAAPVVAAPVVAAPVVAAPVVAAPVVAAPVVAAPVVAPPVVVSPVVVSPVAPLLFSSSQNPGAASRQAALLAMKDQEIELLKKRCANLEDLLTLKEEQIKMLSDDANLQQTKRSMR